MTIEGLTFAEQVANVKGCLDYLIRDKENMSEDSEAYAVANDAEQCMDFLNKLEEILQGACVLAVYAGEDWGHRKGDGYGFGADSYYWCGVYQEAGLKLCDEYGTEDFYDTYQQYFNENIKPKEKESEVEA